jgi:MoxR-like ATPase
MVPSRLSTYVPFGHFKDVESILRSKSFYNIFITGLSGNGKTEMVTRVCAKLKRELFRVNITIETDEDDLLGGFRLLDGETVWQDGPVVACMKRGGVLLLDEIDLGSNKLMCLQPVLEGKGIFLKKTNQWIKPAAGFTVLATANTKGKGDMDGRFAGTGIMNEAMLDRFPVCVEQEYPTKATEKKIVLKNMDEFGARDEQFADLLVRWSEIIRKTFYEGAIDEIITTRRLNNIAQAFSIFGDRMKSIEMNIARFDDDTKEAFRNLYTKIDVDAVSDDDDTTVVSGDPASNKCPF